MKSNRSLDDAIREIRQDQLDSESVSRASQRVWTRISKQPGFEVTEIRGCDDFCSLIPAYKSGELSEARRLLFEDHTKECVACRKVLSEERTEELVQADFKPGTDHTSFWMRWGSIAAVLLLTVGLFQMGALDRLVPWRTAAVAVLQDSEGGVFEVLEEGTALIGVDQTIRSRQSVRTAKDSGAVLVMSDGSKVEMAQRTELAILDGWFDTTIQLKRGNVIVEAVPQRSGHLFVSTDEFRVAVKGTVFSVSHGMKGSRVSVIEGEVLVEKGDSDTVLLPGEQFASQPGLSRVSVEEDIAWSQSSERHMALLEEFSAIQKDFHEATFGPELRYSSRLLGLLPTGTVVYGAIPNVSNQLGDVYQLFMQRVQENATLREWYESRFSLGVQGQALDELVERMTGLGEYLGDEIVFAIVQNADGSAPAVLAQVTDESRFRTMVDEEADIINAQAEGDARVLVVDDLGTVGTVKGMIVLVDAGLVIASPSRDLLATIGEQSSGEFSESRFYQEILASYAEGVDWLLSVDLETLAISNDQMASSGELARLGFAQLNDLVVQRKRNQEGIAENRAVLTYEGDGDEGIVSWIADPGPIGGMEFVSPEAYLAAAFVINDPSKMVGSLLRFLEERDTSAVSELEQFESEHGISILDDIAAPLGGEVVFAIDGPMLPEPSWKVIVEVYDPQRLQQTIEKIVDEVNQIVRQDGGAGIEMQVDASGGLAVYSLRKAGSPVSIEYGYANGYMIITPDRSLIHSARQSQSARYTLASSPSFVRSLPQDSSVNLSAVFYQNLGPMLNAIISSPVGDSIGNISPEAGESMSEFLKTVTPMLITVSAEPGKLTLASGGDLESFWLNLGTLASLGGPQGIGELLRGRLQAQ